MRWQITVVLTLAGLLGAYAQAPAELRQAASPIALAAAPTELSAEPPGSAEMVELASDLNDIISQPGWNSASYGVLVISLERGDTLFSLNPDRGLAPASNMKLYSTAAALYYLGPDFRYSTYTLANGEISDGVLYGDLILFGTGDPTISGRLLESTRATFESIADTLLTRGIREIRGDVVGDGTYFDDDWIGEGWKEDDRMAWYAAPVGALMFGEDMISVRILPGASPGAPAEIRTTPATTQLGVSNQVRTVSSGSSRVRFEHTAEGLAITGQIRTNHPGVARRIPVVNPANYAAAALYATLEEKGIRVTGGVRSVRDPSSSAVTLANGGHADSLPPRVLATHLSPPLSEIISVTNHVSHNLFAEALLKTVGRVALGEGTFAGGARAVEYFLECEALVDSAALDLVDGSGLSRFNRVTPRTTIRLLDYMARSDNADIFFSSLPVAGSADGLRRMYDTPAEGNLRAKTGTIMNVSALSGYVTSADGERLAFSIIANNVPSTWRAKRTEDAMGARLAAFRRPAAPLGVTTLPGEPVGVAVDTTDSESGDTAANQEPAARIHEVQSGETLEGIAKDYGITVQALEEANPTVTPRLLQIGQELVIPGS